MLHAILKGKIRGLFDNIKDGMSWRKAYSTYEDFLTASVIGRMTYLPEDVFWKILSNSSTHSILPQNVGSLNQIEFWPNWAVPPWLSKNSQYREPDAFVVFDEVDIIIEAKRDDSLSQNRSQWKEQILSYLYKRDQDGEEKKPIVFWVLGGMGDSLTQEKVDSELINLNQIIQKTYPKEMINLAITSWGNLLKCVLDLKYFLADEIHRESKLIVSNNRQHIYRISCDIIDALRLHGIKEWHFLTESTLYWADNSFLTTSFDYYAINDDASIDNKIEKNICWNNLYGAENHFDSAIKWYGGQKNEC